MKPLVPILLSSNGGYVDTAGFLALQGLFTAHVTGNFVTIGAALVFGTSGVVAKLLALPVFCLAVAIVRLAGFAIAASNAAQLRKLLGLEFALLLAGGVLAVRLGPFPNADAGPALITGMVLVSGMAIQNAIQRIYLASFPPTTLMTGNTTQVVIDLVDQLRPTAGPAEREAARKRLVRMIASLLAFAGGCAVAAVLFAGSGMWVFAAPPLLVVAALLVPRGAAEPVEV
jgi:uncharacterized membrane protein YoaK (UPF0700 family)